jgi:hypothetical protein
MEVNFKIIALAALVPLVLGFIWYNPKTLGNVWMKAAGLTEESLKDFNMAKVFILTYVFSFMAGLVIQSMVIHQYGAFSALMSEPGFGEKGSEVMLYLDEYMSKYGDNFRTFGHGVLHGTIGGLFLILPVIAINGLFEKKGFAYIAINTGFWTISLALMGGIICAYA